MRLHTRTNALAHSLRTDFYDRFSLFYGSDNSYGGYNTLDDYAVDYFLVASDSDTTVLDTPGQNYSCHWTQLDERIPRHAPLRKLLGA